MRPRRITSCVRGPPVHQRRLGLQLEAMSLSSEHFPGLHVSWIFSMPPWVIVFLRWLWLLRPALLFLRVRASPTQRHWLLQPAGVVVGSRLGRLNDKGKGFEEASSDCKCQRVKRKGSKNQTSGLLEKSMAPFSL